MFGKDILLKKESKTLINEQNSMLGENLNFASSEAYKRLRTNVAFSLVGEDTTDEDGNTHNCKVIGITSSIKGEGKSLTSLNLSYSLAQTQKKVLLMECDLRLPTFADRLGLSYVPGLSNVLIKANTIKSVMQNYPGNSFLQIAVAGETPPNPSELLGSHMMENLVAGLKKYYDYIILDLPPILAVADAAIVSGLSDGMIVVVRQEHTDKAALADTVRQLRFSNVKILGFVCNSVREQGHSKKNYYKNYNYEYSK